MTNANPLPIVSPNQTFTRAVLSAHALSVHTLRIVIYPAALRCARIGGAISSALPNY